MFEDVQKIINAITYIPTNFGTDEDNGICEFMDNIWDMLRNAGIENLIQDMACGASKFVIIPEKGDWVIKIPFNGYYYMKTDCNEDGDEVYEEAFYEFKYAEGANKWDYCSKEVILYGKAEELDNGMTQFLAETRHFATIDNTPIYIQKKCKALNSVDYANLHISNNSKEVYKLHNYCVVNKKWDLAVVEQFGIETLDMIRDFIESNDTFISDLHSDNVGFALDGTPILFDYSGYND